MSTRRTLLKTVKNPHDRGISTQLKVSCSSPRSSPTIAIIISSSQHQIRPKRIWYSARRFLVAQVNTRLAKMEEAEGLGDPMYPKQEWPPPELCPLCREPSTQPNSAASEWNKVEVLHFLRNFYSVSRPHSYGSRKALVGTAT